MIHRRGAECAEVSQRVIQILVLKNILTTLQWLLFICSCIALCSCINGNSPSNSHVNNTNNYSGTSMYHDIDYFTLKGVDQQSSEISYPAIEINSINDSIRKVVFHFDQGIKTTREFQKTKDFWFSTYMERLDTFTNTVVERIYPSKIVWLYYANDADFKPAYLSAISMYKDSVYKYMEPIESLKYPIFNEIEKLGTLKSNYQFIEKYRLSNEWLTIESEIHDSIGIDEKSKKHFRFNRSLSHWLVFRDSSVAY